HLVLRDARRGRRDRGALDQRRRQEILLVLVVAGHDRDGRVVDDRRRRGAGVGVVDRHRLRVGVLHPGQPVLEGLLVLRRVGHLRGRQRDVPLAGRRLRRRGGGGVARLVLVLVVLAGGLGAQQRGRAVLARGLGLRRAGLGGRRRARGDRESGRGARGRRGRRRRRRRDLRDQPEPQLRLPDHGLDQAVAGVAGDLHHDLVVALGGHRSLGDTRAVHPAVDDVRGLLEVVLRDATLGGQRDLGASLE